AHIILIYEATQVSKSESKQICDRSAMSSGIPPTRGPFAVPSIDGAHATERAKSERSLTGLRRLAEGCQACDLWKHATQTVFGEGSLSARIMFVGEQPGDKEDLAGHPFVGPAGRLLDQCLQEAGIERNQVYVTNAVKHFKWEPAERGKRRIHKKPRSSE